MKLVWFIIVSSIILFNSCGKKNNNNETEVKFAVNVKDTLLFESIASKDLSVSLSRIAGANSGEFYVSLSNFTSNMFEAIVDSHSCGVGQTKVFNISYNNTIPFTPAVASCRLTVQQKGLPSNESRRTIYLISKPSCAFNYKFFTNGQSTNTSNVTTVKTITCSFKNDNTLDVSGLTPYLINLGFDCYTNSITVTPTTHNGYNITGSGTFTPNSIKFNLLENTNLIANCILQP